MTPSYEHAAAFIAALTGSVDTSMEWRAISDVKGDGRDPWNRRGTLRDMWSQLTALNAQRYGIFAIINETNGLGRDAQNVSVIRAAWVDLDKGDVAANRQRALTWSVTPHIEVNSSPGKYHLYWVVQPYTDQVLFSEIQRKLIAKFGGDPTINDAPRVMRIPGFIHGKVEGSPHLVTVAAGPVWGQGPWPLDTLAQSLAGVVVQAGGGVAQNQLGDPALAAPTFEWAVRALNAIDPEGLDYAEWRDVTFAFKQSIWSHTNEFVAKTIWDAWAAKYSKNDPGENDKVWRSAKAPRMGWPGLLKRSGMKAQMMFGNAPGPGAGGVMPLVAGGVPVVSEPVPVAPDGGGQLGTFLTPQEQAKYFAGCTYIVMLGQILAPSGMFLDSGQFNAVYGGKAFIHTEDGKTTDEAWKAATRGQVFKIPQAEFTRFLPAQPIDQPFIDEFGLRAINTYRPARIRMKQGDPTPFVEHLRKVLPCETDVMIYLSYLAHCVQRPGVKAKWAPLIQSTEGAGKGLIAQVMTHAVGRAYTHSVNARELAEGGGKFNGWMEGKLLIIADEIRVDDRRDMIEVLKPMITDATIEIQRKGVDQVIGDNVSNWIMFSNYKDAIPITNNSRRFAIFYSPLQTKADLERAGMGSDYFVRMFGWLESDGYEIVADYLKRFEIPVHLDPAKLAQTAPITSSHNEALKESLGQYEQRIADAVEEGRQGFKGGWVSTFAVARLLGGKVAPRTVAKAIENLGYFKIGRASGAIMLEDMGKPTLYCLEPNAHPDQYPQAQGY